jgi:2-methylisocitrate lyase-like PEP mutase family enzyme
VGLRLDVAAWRLGHDVAMSDDQTKDRASELLRLHRDPELLTVVNVWDVISATTVAAVEGTRALATASHSIAASFGYPDGENIPLDLMLEQVKRIVDSTTLPVTADLEGGYGNAPETVRRAIGLGVVGANIEDQMKPLTEAAKQVEAIMKAAEQEGVDFVLNARTDAFALRRGGDPAENLAEAITRGKAFLDAGAPVVFVPAILDEAAIDALVEAFGPQRLSTIGIPGTPSLAWQQEHGVARVSYGPMSQNVALTALQELVEDVQRGGGVPSTMRMLN